MKCVWENWGIHQMMFTFCQFSCKFLGFSMTFFVNIGFISLYFALLICKLLINTNPTRNVVNTNHKAKIEDAKITYALETSTFLFFLLLRSAIIQFIFTQNECYSVYVQHRVLFFPVISGLPQVKKFNWMKRMCVTCLAHRDYDFNNCVDFYALCMRYPIAAILILFFLMQCK